jgi:short subunit dehydrogenase-like uncharacterized protein
MCEVVTIPRHVTVRRIAGFVDAGLASRLATLPTPALIDSLPDGPDPDARRGQRFRYTVDAVLADGARRTGIVEGTDTYGTTAVVAVESARWLADDPAPSGVLAPAEAFDPADLLAFLSGHGLTWWTGPADANVYDERFPLDD